MVKLDVVSHDLQMGVKISQLRQRGDLTVHQVAGGSKYVQHQLTIKSKWDGTPIPEQDWVLLTYDERCSQDIVIRIDAPFYNDPAPEARVGSTWALWNYEVVELFLVSSQGSYLELEFGPHGHFLALWLTGPREIHTKHIPIVYDARINAGRWSGVARVSKAQVPSPVDRWNAFSISGIESSRRYLASHALPGDAPNFHQPDAFECFPV